MADQPDSQSTPATKPGPATLLLVISTLMLASSAIMAYVALSSHYRREISCAGLVCDTVAVICAVLAYNRFTVRNAWKRTACCLGVVVWFVLIYFHLFLTTTTCIYTFTNKTRAQVAALILAAKQYESIYEVLPAADGPVRDYDRLVAVLVGQSPENTRKIPFLTPNSDKDGRPGFKDPWGNDFRVVFSSSGTIQAGTGGICQTVKENVAVWSKGKNQKDDHGAGDDIVSWWR